ncbi:peptidoglycan DD-metalloendopeptidase family protein [Tahibacter amnicola]|uniref:Peptidoglycan DD-metalloendopeptidase family protein n=1 Tax=Tahibacter amnicola TaxID=2976241 RepID=A0ABY6BMC7_9GAMM|nr:peptidoglycan DD-metalloendopeptidase family protein [Tahibacter amnicola]UXI69716.1 peptidoglycan DD-metalloendopeptidase family protein [Tahibacter amnicola]
MKRKLHHSMRELYRCGRALPLALLLAACASTPPAPVDDIAVNSHERDRELPAEPVRAPRPAAPATHRVAAGDTLYSIAFKNRMDYRDLARLNRIEAPFRIYVGQEIRLGQEPTEATGAATFAAESAPRSTASTPRPASPTPFEPVESAPARPATSPPVTTASASASTLPPGTTTTSISTITPLSSSPPPRPVTSGAASAAAGATASTASATAAKPVADPRSGATTGAAVPSAPAVTSLTPTPSGATAAASTPPVPPSTAPPATVASNGGIKWRWPAAGKVIASYVGGDQTRQGVDIAGSAGAPVYAAADGSVVYSGNGLLGYGELVIVKHSASFLSAYGHNRKRLVKEGDTVKAGQAIAEMGSMGSSREMLHFEIRRNGKPVNPLEYLPPR